MPARPCGGWGWECGVQPGKTACLPLQPAAAAATAVLQQHEEEETTASTASRRGAHRAGHKQAARTVVVVLADKDAGQVPQRRDVEGLENLALQAEEEISRAAREEDLSKVKSGRAGRMGCRQDRRRGSSEEVFQRPWQHSAASHASSRNSMAGQGSGACLIGSAVAVHCHCHAALALVLVSQRQASTHWHLQVRIRGGGTWLATSGGSLCKDAW